MNRRMFLASVYYWRRACFWSWLNLPLMTNTWTSLSWWSSQCNPMDSRITLHFVNLFLIPLSFLFQFFLTFLLNLFLYCQQFTILIIKSLNLFHKIADFQLQVIVLKTYTLYLFDNIKFLFTYSFINILNLLYFISQFLQLILQYLLITIHNNPAHSIPISTLPNKIPNPELPTKPITPITSITSITMTSLTTSISHTFPLSLHISICNVIPIYFLFVKLFYFYLHL